MGVRTKITRHEEMRRRLGLGVTELARRVGYSHAYVSQVEGGTISPSAKYRAAVSSEFGVPAAIIFDEESVPTPAMQKRHGRSSELANEVA